MFRRHYQLRTDGIALLVAVLMTVSLLHAPSPLFANPVRSNGEGLSHTMEGANAIPSANMGDISAYDDSTPHGVKSYLVKKAVELIAAALRHGGDVLAYILKWVDDDAARAISKNGGKIAKALDDIAKIPNLTTQIVREKLYYFLTNTLSLSGGTSLQIADAVATTINWLIL